MFSLFRSEKELYEEMQVAKIQYETGQCSREVYVESLKRLNDLLQEKANSHSINPADRNS